MMASDNLFAAMQGAAEEAVAERRKKGRMLDDVDLFSAIARWMANSRTTKYEEAGQMYCDKCGGLRTMDAEGLYVPREVPCPSFYKITCRQCDQQFMTVLYKTEKAPYNLCTLPYYTGNAATPHTPAEVKFYLVDCTPEAGRKD